MDLEANISELLAKVRRAEKEAGRPEGAVRVLAVTKYSDSGTTGDIARQGLLDLAENRVDKLLEKQTDLADFTLDPMLDRFPRPIVGSSEIPQVESGKIRWHLIGNLQSRKVKDIINRVSSFHALDSVTLAREIEKRATHVISCYMEVNLSGEATKHGFREGEVAEALEELSGLSKVMIVGLMTMAPVDATTTSLDTLFARTRELQERIAAKHLPHIPCQGLSMGMSRDFESAIKNGATCIRIGHDLIK